MAVYAADIIHDDVCMKQIGKINIHTHTQLWVGWVIGDFPLPDVWNLKNFFFFFFLGPHLWHMEVPRLGVKLDPQLP